MEGGGKASGQQKWPHEAELRVSAMREYVPCEQQSAEEISGSGPLPVSPYPLFPGRGIPADPRP